MLGFVPLLRERLRSTTQPTGKLSANADREAQIASGTVFTITTDANLAQ
jgi:hypothetical protein